MRKLVILVLWILHDASDCGFGNHVFADGTYAKIKAGKPKFELPQ